MCGGFVPPCLRPRRWYMCYGGILLWPECSSFLQAFGRKGFWSSREWRGRLGEGEGAAGPGRCCIFERLDLCIVPGCCVWDAFGKMRASGEAERSGAYLFLFLYFYSFIFRISFHS